jgi:integrase
MQDMLYKRGRIWWVQANDAAGVRFRMSTRTSRKALAKILEGHLHELVERQRFGLDPTPAQLDWLKAHLDAKRLRQLIGIGLVRQDQIDRHQPLLAHVDDWESYLAQKNTLKYARLAASRVRKVLDDSEVDRIESLSGERLVALVANLNLSQSSANHYMTAVKMFAKWLVDHGRADHLPAGLNLVRRRKVTEPKVRRRALTDAEIQKLMKTPAPRRIIYQVALGTGLRANEIRTLRAGAFDLGAGVVHLAAANTKNKQDDALPLSQDLQAALVEHLAHKLPDALAFELPVKAAKWMRQDLDAGVDFHCLRHTFGTRLAQAGVHPKVAQRLMRHSSIELTMQLYTHLQLVDDVQAIEAAALVGQSDSLTLPA